jgi:hypothetical protein
MRRRARWKTIGMWLALGVGCARSHDVDPNETERRWNTEASDVGELATDGSVDGSVDGAEVSVDELRVEAGESVEARASWPGSQVSQGSQGSRDARASRGARGSSSSQGSPVVTVGSATRTASETPTAVIEAPPSAVGLPGISWNTETIEVRPERCAMMRSRPTWCIEAERTRVRKRGTP